MPLRMHTTCVCWSCARVQSMRVTSSIRSLKTRVFSFAEATIDSGSRTPSYQEYFLALAIAECDDIDALERIVSHPISAETRDFVHAIGTRHRREPVLVRRWLDILRSNRAMLLRRFALDMLSNGVRTYKMPAGANLSGMDLRGIRALRKFDWTNVNLGKAQLNHLDARNGQFRDCDFQDAVLANARFENVEFESCEGMPIGLESARGVGTALPEKWKHETKITGRFWRESTNYRGELITLGSDVSSVRTSPDGTRIVTASSDKTARLWDAETGRMLQVLEGHGGWVLSAEFSPDGTRIVTASHDRTARLWMPKPDACSTLLKVMGMGC